MMILSMRAECSADTRQWLRGAIYRGGSFDTAISFSRGVNAAQSSLEEKRHG
jgi:hypothetical protein